MKFRVLWDILPCSQIKTLNLILAAVRTWNVTNLYTFGNQQAIFIRFRKWLKAVICKWHVDLQKHTVTYRNDPIWTSKRQKNLTKGPQTCGTQRWHSDPTYRLARNYYLLVIRGLFNDAVSSSDHIASKAKIWRTLYALTLFQNWEVRQLTSRVLGRPIGT
jgi:hypothetical protein